jgi:ectoine hydroxylase-related dioxygenase (phytanoyl-CoA dioxygenase family)
MISPSSPIRPLHADTLWSEGGCLFTAFVALQPVTRQMGPTRFLRRTHTTPLHGPPLAHAQEIAAAPNPAPTPTPNPTSTPSPASGPDASPATYEVPGGAPSAHGCAASALLESGDATLYDGRLLHGGSANTCPSIVSDEAASDAHELSQRPSAALRADGVRVLFYVTVRRSAADAAEVCA